MQKLLKDKKVLLAWSIAIILLILTIVFAILYSRSKPIDKYEFLNKSLLNIFKNKKINSEQFDVNIISKIDSFALNIDINKIKNSEVLYEFSKNNLGHVGYIIRHVKEGNLISHVFDFQFNSSGIIDNVILIA